MKKYVYTCVQVIILKDCLFLVNNIISKVKVDNEIVGQLSEVEVYAENLATLEACDMDVLKFLTEKVTY